MLTKVTVFETQDGARFDDEAKALEHVADVCRQALDMRLAQLMTDGRLTANDRYRIVMAIVPDAVAAESLATELGRACGMLD